MSERKRHVQAASWTVSEPASEARSIGIAGIAGAGTALVLAAGLFSACEHGRTIVKPPTPVRAATVVELAGGEGVRYSANVIPREQVAAAFKVGGYVKEVAGRRGADGRHRALQAGDEVREGSALASLRENEYADAVAQARASLAAAKASQLKAEADRGRAAALLASKSLTRADYDAALAACDADRARVEGAEAQLRQAETALADCVLRAPTGPSSSAGSKPARWPVSERSGSSSRTSAPSRWSLECPTSSSARSRPGRRSR